MKFAYNDGTILKLAFDCLPTFVGYANDDVEGKAMDCDNLTVGEGQTIGEAACLSTCNCLFCRTLRTSAD
jgi:hypothetical protein